MCIVVFVGNGGVSNRGGESMLSRVACGWSRCRRKEVERVMKGSMRWFQLAMSQSEGNHAHAVLNNGKSTNMDHHSPPSSLQPKTMEAPLRETVRTLPTKKVCAMINSDTSSKREVLVVSMCSHAGV